MNEIIQEQLDTVIASIQPKSATIGEQTSAYIDTLTKPPGSLGKLESLAIELAEMTEQPFPTVDSPSVIVLAGDHGIAEEGVSAFPQEVTVQMVHNFLQGGAAINVFARQIGASVQIVDVGVAQELDVETARQPDDVHEKSNETIQFMNKKIRKGTANFLHDDAMKREEAIQALLTGIDVAHRQIEEGANCIIVGEMGIANTTTSSAMLAVLSGQSLQSIVGRGTGIDLKTWVHKQDVIQQALNHRQPNADDPIDVLSKVGGLEIGAMAGVMLGAAARRKPIIVDGFISTVAALLATQMCEHARDYMVVAHQSQEQGHRIALDLLQKEPLLDLDLRLGEGSGAALAYPLLEAATLMVKEMATFESAGVTDKQS